MSTPLKSTGYKEAVQYYSYEDPEKIQEEAAATIQPQIGPAPLSEPFFSSSPPEEIYLSSPLSDPYLEVRHIKPSDEGEEEGISFQGHSRILPVPLTTSGSISRKISAPEQLVTPSSEPIRRKKKAADDTDQPSPSPARLTSRSKESKSAQDLRQPHIPYLRSRSEMHFNLPSNRSEKEKKPLPVASSVSEMSISSIGTKIYFREEEAAMQLFCSYSHFREHREAMVQELVELRNGLAKERHLNRLHTTLTILLKHHGSGPFICSYIKSLSELTQEETLQFAEHAIVRLSKEQQASSLIQACISRITRCELKNQTRDTLFRETNLSSALCREYGNLLWRKHFKELVKAIEHAVPHKDLPSLSLNYNVVKDQLTRKQETAEPVPPKLLEEAFNENSERFMEFARAVIPMIFEHLPPKEFQEVLISRRQRIIHFIKEHPLEEHEDPVSISRTYISEVLYLRLLHPHLVTADHPPLLNNMLISLSKVLQCLAKENPFGTEKQDPIYERLNPLFEEFIEAHRQFVDACSLPPE